MIRSPSTSDMSDPADDGPSDRPLSCTSPTLCVSSRRDGRTTCPDVRNRTLNTADRRRCEPSTSPERTRTMTTFGATAATFHAAPPERDNGAQRGALLSVVPPPAVMFDVGDHPPHREVRFSPSAKSPVDEIFPTTSRSYETATPSGEVLFRKPAPPASFHFFDAPTPQDGW